MPASRNSFVLIVCLLFSPLLVGCGAGLTLPPVSPADAASNAMELYDENGDGTLDETELVACPALKAEVYEFDANADGKLSEEEIFGRLDTLYGRRVGLTPSECKVTLDGEPLEGATVKYVPDPLLGEGTTRPAEGVTDSAGVAKLSVAPEHIPDTLGGRKVMQVGLYRVEITHPSKDIPAKYNTETILGFELNPNRHLGPNGEFELESN